MQEVIDSIQTSKTIINKPKLIPYTCNIEVVRTSLGMSRSDLASKLGKTYEFICMIEHLKYYPVLTTRIKIAKILNTDTSALWIPINISIKTKKEQSVNSDHLNNQN